MSQLPVSSAVKEALLEKKGTLYSFLEIVKAYEAADWFVFTKNSCVEGIEIEKW